MLVYHEAGSRSGRRRRSGGGERLQRLAPTHAGASLSPIRRRFDARGIAPFRITRAKDARRRRASAGRARREIARMRSGAAVTDEARAAARRLFLKRRRRPAPRKRARAEQAECHSPDQLSETKPKSELARLTKKWAPKTLLPGSTRRRLRQPNMMRCVAQTTRSRKRSGIDPPRQTTQRGGAKPAERLRR